MAGLKVKIGADASQFERTMRGVRKDVKGVKNSIAGIAGAVGAVWAVNTAFEALKASTRVVIDNMKEASAAAADFEMMQVQFEVMTGSAETAAQLMETFRQEAQKSSLTLQDWAKSAKTLVAFGTDAKDVVPIMKMIGDVSMGNSERFNLMTLAFAQVGAAGRLMGQEVRQMVNAGFNPLQQISERTGESMLTLKKRMEDGKVPFSEVVSAFKDATGEGGRFFKAIDRGADTFAGKMNKTKDAVFGLRLAFGEGFNEGLKVALDASTDFLGKFEEVMKETGAIFGSAIRDAVHGNTEMFEQMGLLIGETILSGMKGAFQFGAEKAFEGLLRGAGELSFGIGGDKVKDFLGSQADIVAAGSKAGFKGNVAATVAQAQNRIGNLQELNRQSQARIPIEMFSAPTSPPPALPQHQTEFLGELKQINAKLGDMINFAN